MDYIVFDLEWNQCPYGKGQENEKIPFEIIEIGAVKLNSQKELIDRYHTLIQPRVYRKMHFRTKEIIQLDMKDLEKGTAFYKAIREFLKWCGEDYRFCTWGNTDLLELQRNMKYYGVLSLLKGPLTYLDVQKLFSIQYGDGESRKSLEYAVDYMKAEKDTAFHRALADAEYTAIILGKITDDISDVFYSVDCYQNPKEKKEEIHIKYPEYEKYISREFKSKEQMMEDKEIISTRCLICGKNARKKIRWFSSGQKNYYCLANCCTHGWIKGRIRVKKAEDGNVFAIKTLQNCTEEDAEGIREKREEIRRKRRERRKQEKNKNKE